MWASIIPNRIISAAVLNYKHAAGSGEICDWLYMTYILGYYTMPLLPKWQELDTSNIVMFYNDLSQSPHGNKKSPNKYF